MQHSDRPYLELLAAQRAVAEMRLATNLEAVQEHWKDFLGRLERVWNKSVSHFGKSPKWNGWQGAYLKLRKHDPLLSYLINARGAEEHTIADITKSEPGFVGIGPGPDSKVYINLLRVEGGVIHFEADSQTTVHVHAPHVKLLPITNRGVVYDAPLQHLSQPIDPKNLGDIAEKAIAFYSKFLDQAEAFFVKPGG